MSHRVVESTSELSAFIKAGVMAGSERDADFSSGGDEDDMSGLHSPSASEDSVEVQVTPISSRNKRKLAEPRKIQEQSAAPLKKRRFERIEETIPADEEECRTDRSPSPFRPWNSPVKSENVSKATRSTIFSSPSNEPSSSVGSSVVSKKSTDDLEIHEQDYELEDDRDREDVAERVPSKIEEANEAEIREDASYRLGESQTQTRPPRIERRDSCSSRQKLDTATISGASTSTGNSRLQEEPLSLVFRGEIADRVPSHPAVNGSYERTCSYSIDHALSSSSSSSSSFSSLSSSLNHRHRDRRSGGSANLRGSSSSTTTTTATTTLTATTTAATTATTVTTAIGNTNPQAGHSRQTPTAGQQRNYKNMTRERRIEANARERTRVHTISAAFDTLRRAIPAYSHNQKLSKLSVLRIACSYIMTLGKIVNTPAGEAANGASLGACVDLVSRTIQTEGKLRKRKED